MVGGALERVEAAALKSATLFRPREEFKGQQHLGIGIEVQ
jgi:hypothetical protein